MTDLTPHATPMRRARGFTLIELMITVAIVAILAAIALPAYRNAVVKGQRAEGRAALLDLMQQQERFFTQQNTYRAFAAGATGTPFKTWSGEASANAAYLMSAAACPGLAINTCVIVTAERQASKGPDADVANLTMMSTGKKSCTGSKPTLCWP